MLTARDMTSRSVASFGVNWERSMDELDEIEREIERIDQGGDAWEDTDAVVGIEVKQPLDIVVPVRLSTATWDGLYKEARQHGIGPSALVRMWVLEKLRVPAGRPPGAASRADGGRWRDARPPR